MRILIACLSSSLLILGACRFPQNADSAPLRELDLVHTGGAWGRHSWRASVRTTGAVVIETLPPGGPVIQGTLPSGAVDTAIEIVAAHRGQSLGRHRPESDQIIFTFPDAGNRLAINNLDSMSDEDIESCRPLLILYCKIRSLAESQDLLDSRFWISDRLGQMGTSVD